MNKTKSQLSAALITMYDIRGNYEIKAIVCPLGTRRKTADRPLEQTLALNR